MVSPALLTLVDLRRRLLYSLEPRNPVKLIVSVAFMIWVSIAVMSRRSGVRLVVPSP